MQTTTREDFTAANKFNTSEAAEVNVQTHVSACEICGTNCGFPVNKIPPMLHTQKVIMATK